MQTRHREVARRPARPARSVEVLPLRNGRASARARRPTAPERRRRPDGDQHELSGAETTHVSIDAAMSDSSSRGPDGTAGSSARDSGSQRMPAIPQKLRSTKKRARPHGGRCWRAARSPSLHVVCHLRVPRLRTKGDEGLERRRAEQRGGVGSTLCSTWKAGPMTHHCGHAAGAETGAREADAQPARNRQRRRAERAVQPGERRRLVLRGVAIVANAERQ